MQTSIPKKEPLEIHITVFVFCHSPTSIEVNFEKLGKAH